VESDLVDSFLRLDCKDSLTVPPPNYTEIFLNSQLEEKRGKFNLPTKIPVLKSSSLYPINKLEEIAEYREFSFSHDSEYGMPKKPDEGLSGFMSVPVFDKKSTSKGAEFDPHMFAELLE
jgi:hypothetical protein